MRPLSRVRGSRRKLRSRFPMGLISPKPLIWLRKGGVPEWLKGTDCKSVGFAYAGSNPAPSTTMLGMVGPAPFRVLPMALGKRNGAVASALRARTASRSASAAARDRIRPRPQAEGFGATINVSSALMPGRRRQRTSAAGVASARCGHRLKRASSAHLASMRAS